MVKKIIIGLILFISVITNFILFSLYSYQNDISNDLQQELIKMEEHLDKQDSYINYLENLKSTELQKVKFSYLNKVMNNTLKGLPKNYNIDETEIPPTYISYKEGKSGFVNWYQTLPKNILTKIKLACF